MRRFFHRLLTFMRSTRAESDLAREVDAHLRLLEDNFIAQGMTARAASDSARRAFGGQVEQMKERQRDARSFRVLDQSWLDIKLALRLLIRYPGLTVVGVFGMSIAIAIAAGAFSIIDGLLDPSLPLPEGERIVSLQNWNPATNNADRRAAHDFAMWRQELKSVQEVTAFRQLGRNLIAAGTQPEVVRVAQINASGFRVARVAPLLGRYLVEDDDREGAAPVVVIGHDIWKARFVADPNIIGRNLQLGETTYAIVGVMPEGFAFPVDHQVWIPLTAGVLRHERGSGPDIMIFGRLADGATLESAQAELSLIGQRASATAAAAHAQLRPQVLPYTYPYSDMDEPENALALRLIQYLVSILLGLVCVNVAILVYARTVTRQAEIAVRSALGAGRQRIVAQLFIEALSLSSVAAAIGLLVVDIGLREVDAALLQVIGQLPFWMDFSLSPGAIVYTIVLAVAAAAIVGVVPAIKVTGRHVQSGLREMSAGCGGGGRLGRTWTMLIVVQVAVAVALLPSAVYQAWYAASHGAAHYGFPADEVLAAELAMDRTVSRETDDEAFRSRFGDRQVELTRRVAAEAQIRRPTTALHHAGQEPLAWIEIEGVETPSQTDDYSMRLGSATGHRVRFNRIGADWLDVFDLPVIAGRGLTGGDGPTAVVVNEHFVRDLLHGENPLGRRIRYAGISREAYAGGVDLEQWFDVVGVIGDIPAGAVAGDANARVYHPLAPGQFHPVMMAMRVHGGDARVFAPRLRELSVDVDPNLQLGAVRRMDDVLGQEFGFLRLMATMLALLTVSVIAVAAAGIYALMSCAVEQRRKEIGIRVALGADPRRILTAIFTRALAQLAAGALVGVIVAALLSTASGGDFVAGHGAVIVPLVALVMMIVGVCAALGPARRGLNIHVIDTLKAD